MALSLLYRGPLSSCNYACEYCPFAKRKESPVELARDRDALDRFVSWVEARRDETSVFFTPWGEALVRRRYRDAIVRLSHLPHLRRVAIQTNLHAPLDFLREAARDRVALWCTYHPDQTSRARFLARCEALREMHVRFSVGVVGLREHVDEAEALRAALPPDVYVWVNAYKRAPAYYDDATLARLMAVDPLFGWNNVRHPSRGHACRAGHSVLSVDGDGNARRCHFTDAPRGNLYDGSLRLDDAPAPCPNATCGCHIGYVHLERLRLDRVFGDGLLERIPNAPLSRSDAARASGASDRRG